MPFTEQDLQYYINKIRAAIDAQSSTHPELCERCVERHRSRLNCIRAGERTIERMRKGANVESLGIISDPAPKHECKRHEGYQDCAETREVCRDFEALAS